MQIHDGKGSGVLAQVSKENKLAITGIAASPQLHASAAYGRAYQVITPIINIATAGAYGLLAVQNQSDKNMVITYMRVGVDDNETAQALFELYMGGSWVGGGTQVFPVNLNGRFSLDSGIIAHYNSIPTSASAIDRRWMKGPNENTWNKEGSIILPTNNVFSMKVTTETNGANVYGRISFIMLTDEELESF